MIGTTCPGHWRLSGASIQEEETYIWTDSARIEKKGSPPRSGCGIWNVIKGDRKNIGIRIQLMTKAAPDIAAAVPATTQVPNFAPLHIITTSLYTVDALTPYLEGWERRGWTGVLNADLLRATAARLRQLSAITTFQWANSNRKTPECNRARNIARDAVKEPSEIVQLGISIPDKFDTSTDQNKKSTTKFDTVLITTN